MAEIAERKNCVLVSGKKMKESAVLIAHILRIWACRKIVNEFLAVSLSLTVFTGINFAFYKHEVIFVAGISGKGNDLAKEKNSGHPVLVFVSLSSLF